MIHDRRNALKQHFQSQPQAGNAPFLLPRTADQNPGALIGEEHLTSVNAIPRLSPPPGQFFAGGSPGWAHGGGLTPDRTPGQFFAGGTPGFYGGGLTPDRILTRTADQNPGAFPRPSGTLGIGNIFNQNPQAIFPGGAASPFRPQPQVPNFGGLLGQLFAGGGGLKGRNPYMAPQSAVKGRLF